jgi:predicted enzyme related to lactoylglutathione lyase
VFQIWEAKRSIGARILNEPGALCWTELTTSDTKAAEAFYTQLFGWTPKHGGAGTPMEYTEFSVGGNPSIGMMAKPAGMPAHIPSYWMPYFQVTNVDTSASKGKELGGKVMIGPQDIPGTGRFAILTDPQGAMFAIFQR